MSARVASAELLARAAEGKLGAAARLISRAEAGVVEARPALAEAYRRAGRAHLVGITGVPGSGKSTLVGRLVRVLRATGARVAVVAIDPSSPYSGGAILGDRVRMSELGTDPGVFIRSMATRGATGGMARAALDAADILDVAGFEFVIIETVGVGQDEVEIAKASHTTVVVSAPGLGDEIQAIKAGILEIADIHVVSKCDRPDANRTLTDLKQMLALGLAHATPDAWIVPVVGTSALTGEGVDELVDSIRRHRTTLPVGARAARARRIAAFRLEKTAQNLLLEQFQTRFNGQSDERIDSLAARAVDPYSTALDLLNRMMHGGHAHEPVA